MDDEIVTVIDEPDVRGVLVHGQPHATWTYRHGDDVRAVLWRFGELVAVLTPPIVPDGTPSGTRRT